MPAGSAARRKPTGWRSGAILERFQLAELKNELAVRLSGGQKRLLEFARIAAAEPRLIILDEPMGGVNPVLGDADRRGGRAFRRATAAP